LFSLLRSFSASKLLLLPKKSILLKATNPVSVDSELAYKDRSRSACRESVCRAISISSLDRFSYKKKGTDILLFLMLLKTKSNGKKLATRHTIEKL
jgi:hypothetical protein